MAIITFNISASGNTQPYSFSTDNVNFSSGGTLTVSAFGIYPLYMKDIYNNVSYLGTVTIDNYYANAVIVGYMT